MPTIGNINILVKRRLIYNRAFVHQKPEDICNCISLINTCCSQYLFLIDCHQSKTIIISIMTMERKHCGDQYYNSQSRHSMQQTFTLLLMGLKLPLVVDIFYSQGEFFLITVFCIQPQCKVGPHFSCLDFKYPIMSISYCFTSWILSSSIVNFDSSFLIFFYQKLLIQ